MEGCRELRKMSQKEAAVPPLGLKLTITPEFLDRIQKAFSQGSKSSVTYVDQVSEHEKSGVVSINDHRINQTRPEKLKATKFPASSLQIGTWKCIARYEGDLVAKFYYTSRKMVWEVLHQGLKYKIEIKWSDISAIRASFHQNEPGVLEIELNQVPSFFRERPPHPRKHTIWHSVPDFTGDQATICRRHYLKFPEGILNKHYQKLLENDEQMFILSRRPFPSSLFPCFNKDEGPSLTSYGHHEPGFPSGFQFPQSSVLMPNLNPFHQVQDLKPMIGPSPVVDGTTPPTSVIDLAPIDENCNWTAQRRDSFWGPTMANINGNVHMRLEGPVHDLSSTEPTTPLVDSIGMFLSTIEINQSLNYSPEYFDDERKLAAKMYELSSILATNDDCSNENDQLNVQMSSAVGARQPRGVSGLPWQQPLTWFQTSARPKDNSLLLSSKQ